MLVEFPPHPSNNKNKGRAMPRVPRRIFPGMPHHVTQRGNRRGDVFFSDADRSAYLHWLGEYCDFYGVQVLAYCLMSNHTHAVLVPERETSLEDALRALHTRFALRVNRIHGWSGHVWQGRFFSAVLDEAYLRAATRYVELNPVRAGLAERAENYRWSSAAAHCGLRQDALLAPVDPWLPDMTTGPEWSDWLSEGVGPQEMQVIRENVRRSVPCGSEAFIQDLERRAGRPLRPARRGRPRKVQPA
jgi:putative transposase